MGNLKKQLQNLNVAKLKMKNGSSVENELKRHARILQDCIQEALQEVYDSYSPKVYSRSYGLYNSLYVDDDIRVDISSSGSTLSVGLHFNGMAIHDSFTGEEANTAVLLNEGWQTHGRFKDVPVLGWREGTHFIENGIEDYKRRVRKPFAIKLTINDEERIF